MSEPNPRKDKILIVGGYGAVGGMIAAELHNKFPEKIMVAGRDADKARAFIAPFQGKMGFRKFDAFDTAQMSEFLPEVKLVINAVDMLQPYLLNGAIRHRCDYVDITAGRRFLERALALDMNASVTGITAVVGMGLLPGITNLLAAYCASKMDDVLEVDVYALQDINENFGPAAMRHILKLVPEPFYTVQQGNPARFANFSDPVDVAFPGNLGTHKCARFGLVDQFFFPKTLGAGTSSTRIAFSNPNALTTMTMLSHAGCLSFFILSPLFNYVMKWLTRRQSGTESLFCELVKVKGLKMARSTEVKSAFWGVGASKATADVTSELAAMIYRGELKNPGVSLPEELPLSIPTFMARLARYGYQFELG